MQLRHASVRSVTARIILLRPNPPRVVEIANLVTFLQQFTIELLAAFRAQRIRSISDGSIPGGGALQSLPIHLWTEVDS